MPPRCTTCGLSRDEAEFAILELGLWDAECCDVAGWIQPNVIPLQALVMDLSPLPQF